MDTYVISADTEDEALNEVGQVAVREAAETIAEVVAAHVSLEANPDWKVIAMNCFAAGVTAGVHAMLHGYIQGVKR